MAIFSPTIYYFGQPVAASGFIIRPDTYASSVSLALPGTQFGSTFGQTDFRSDISGYINGGSSMSPTPPVTGSPSFPSASVNFAADGYTTSMAKGAGSVANFTFPGSATNVNFGTGAFTIEAWFNPATTSANDIVLYFAYTNQFGFVLYSSAGYYRWVAQNGAGGETLVDYAGGNPATGTWVHLAFCRSGSTWYACLNGTIRGNLTLAGTTGTGGAMNCMNWPGSTGQRASNWQDFRITKGVARYTGAVNASYTRPLSIVTIG
jgi:hypothetical protein